MSAERPLNPDELAELEEQRKHLLSSLDDLDAEFAAGDIDVTDYRSLRDDYTRRTANVVRAIDAGKASIAAAAPKRSTRERVLVIGGVAAFALVAGLLLARSAGFRSSSDTATGDIRDSTRSLLLEAGELAGSGDLDAAIATYDDVLDLQPSNAEALTYKAWYLYLGSEDGESDGEIERLLDAAVASEADFPDPRVFRAVLFTNQERFAEAADELAAFDATDPPPGMQQIVEQQGLRERALAGLLAAAPDGEVTVEAYGVSAETMARAAQLLMNNGQAGVAIRAFGAALDADPDNVTALLGRGDLLVATGQQTATDDPDGAAALVADGRASIERAVALAPESVEAQFALLSVAVITGDAATVDQQLDVLDGFDLSESDRQVLDDLRAALAG